MAYQYPYPRPSVTLDLVFFAVTPRGPRVLLIERAAPPHAGRWALPGGYLDMDEDLETGARRELLEETRVEVGATWQVGAFGAVDRDPRGRTITVAYLAVHVGEAPPPTAGDDASATRWHSAQRLPKLAFDHREVIAAARALLAERSDDAGRLATLLPRRFALADLQALHEFAAGPRATASFAASARRRRAVRATGARRGRVPLYSLAPPRSRP